MSFPQRATVTALLASGCAPGSDELPVRYESEAELDRMREYVETRYPEDRVRHTFSLPSGDVVDCVDLEAQPGLARPEMAGHVVASPPDLAPTPDDLPEEPRLALPDAEAFLRVRCPRGTIPIRQVTLEDVARFETLADMMYKAPGARDGDDDTRLGPTAYHQYAHAAEYDLPNVGAHAAISIWSPYVQSSSEFSLGQLWIVGGSGRDLQTLEAGVQTFPDLYGNWEPNLFVYSTSDNYRSQGCYNLQCSRFVQVDGSVVIGGRLSPYSTAGGPWYELSFTWLLSDGNWWLGVGGIWVGYYPGNLFDAAGVAYGGTTIDFGGEIIDDRDAHTRHTWTAMGSGAYPSAGWTEAAYQRLLYYYTDPSTAIWATGLAPSRDDASCYDVATFEGDPDWGTYILYGGPGRNASCR